MLLTSFCQWSDIDLLLLNSSGSDGISLSCVWSFSWALALLFNCLQALFSARFAPPELFQDLSQLQETWLAEGECFKSQAKKKKGGEMGKNW